MTVAHLETLQLGGSLWAVRPADRPGLGVTLDRERPAELLRA